MAAHHPTELARRVLRTPGLGHEQRFLPPTLDARCRFSHETFTGTRGNGRDAPIPDLASNAIRSVGVGTQRRNSLVISLAEMPLMTKDLRPEFRSLAC
jgi:hypothetical protein